MNGSKSKLIRKKAHSLMYDWLHTLVSEEDAKDITKDNYRDFFPTLEKYIYHNRNLKLSSFTERWFIQNIKKQSKIKNIDDITLQDIV
jgi:hypothetical protein|tara:strand:+ start:704 stop:967 length:264 start_codon:yes stop_codon:yes gene_type:complete